MNKYRNIKTIVDGIVFASKKEAKRYCKRYCELKLLLKGKKIFNLECQPKFPLIVNGEKVGTYIADFSYTDMTSGGNGYTIVEDVKGVKTSVYRLKKKLVRALHDIAIKEV